MMAPRLTWFGILAYLFVTVVLALQTVRISRNEAGWGGEDRWAVVVLLVIVGLTALLFVIGAVSRTPLVGDETRALGRRGGLAVIGLTALGLGVVMVTSLDTFGVWPSGMAMFVPYGVRRLEDAYREGVEEGRLVAKAMREEQG